MTDTHTPQAPFVQPSRLNRIVLRLFDLALTLPLALLAAPLYAIARLTARRRDDWLVGREGQPFKRVSLTLGNGPFSRLARYLRIDQSPVLWNLLVGNMSWVGPRALGLNDPARENRPEACEQLRPGLFSLWTLRQRTSIDYDDEGRCDAELLNRLTPGRWLGILLRNLLASLYGRTPLVTDPTPALIDTVRVHPLTMNDTLDALDQRLANADGAPLQLCFVNPDCINQARRNAAYRHCLNQADLVVPDGIGMRLAGSLLGRGFRQNVNGTDLFPRLLERLGASGHRLYLLGGSPGVAEATADWARQACPDVVIAGHHHGFFTAEEQAGVIADIRASGADVLLVAMGAPRQELWIAENAQACGVKVAMGVGGLFDFCAGRIPRAPQWLRELGLEWSWRLYQEPGRMWRRYLIGNLSFLIAVAMQRWLGSIDTAPAAHDDSAGQHRPLAQQAVLLADLFTDSDFLPDQDGSTALLPLGDRSLLYRSLEIVASLGCQRVTLLACRGLPALRQEAGNGERWGLDITVCAVRDLQDARQRIKRLALEPEETLLIGRVDHLLPASTLGSNRADAAWMYLDEDNRLQWAGWGLVSCQNRSEWLSAINPDGLLVHRLPEAVEQLGAPQPFRFDQAERLLQAQSRWLARQPDGFELYRETAPGIRIAASARLGRGVELQAPVEIGPHCIIESGARIGPNVVIGERCTIGGEVELRDSLVAGQVVLAGQLQVEQTIVVADGLYSQRHQAWLPASALAPVIGSRQAGGQRPRIGIDERLLALGLILLAAIPVAVARLSGRGGRFSRELYRQLPQVVAGRMALLGPDPRAPLPDTLALAGWHERLKAAGPALLRPSEALGLEDDEAAAWADLHWLLNPSFGERLRLLRHYFRRPRAKGFTVEPQS
ncbi:MAG: WecB/TagA/CpsF family glycosyltransferase [Wenzhouxiangella sp.]